MAVGDWAEGTRAVLLESHVTYDGTEANNPTRTQVRYRMRLPSGYVLQDIRALDLPGDHRAAADAMLATVQGHEGLEQTTHAATVTITADRPQSQ